MNKPTKAWLTLWPVLVYIFKAFQFKILLTSSIFKSLNAGGKGIFEIIDAIDLKGFSALLGISEVCKAGQDCYDKCNFHIKYY